MATRINRSRLRSERESLGLSQEQLAGLAKVTKLYIAETLHYNTVRPRSDLANKMKIACKKVMRPRHPAKVERERTQYRRLVGRASAAIPQECKPNNAWKLTFSELLPTRHPFTAPVKYHTQ